MTNTTVEMMTTKEGEAYEGSGNAEFVIGGLMSLASIGLFMYAFQSVVSDLPYTASALLFAFALGALGAFVMCSGMRKQRIAAEIAERQAAEREAATNAQAVAVEAIERARRK
jgi:hypothetical protein